MILSNTSASVLRRYRASVLCRYRASAPNLRSLLLKAILLLLILDASSCRRRPLEEEWESGDYAEILLVTDWKLLKEVPTGISAIFYPDDGTTPIRVMSNNIKQNVVRLRRGSYHVIIFNQSEYEFGSMTFSGMDNYETACATLNQLSPNSTLTAADYRWLTTVLHTPDSVALGMREPEFFNADRFIYEVTEDMCRRQYLKDNGAMNDVQIWDVPEQTEYIDTIFSTPPPVPPTLYVTARVRGINNAYQVRAYITNMARSDLFGPHRNTTTPAIHVISNWAIAADPGVKEKGEIRGSVRCFGVPGLQVAEHDLYYNLGDFDFTRAPQGNVPGASSRTRALVDHPYGDNIIVFDFLLKDGKTHAQQAFDVTDAITYDQGELRLEVELDQGTIDPDYPIILPDVPDVIGSGGAGFDATVEEWQHEDHTISF